jgi:hypothetical protein
MRCVGCRWPLSVPDRLVIVAFRGAKDDNLARDLPVFFVVYLIDPTRILGLNV